MPTPADDDFKKWFDDYLAEWRGFVEECLADGEEIKPHMTLVKKIRPGTTVAKAAVVVQAPMDTPDQRSAVFKLQHLVARETDLIEAVVVVSEAWAVTIDTKGLTDEQHKDKVDEAQQYSSLANHPYRTEIVIWTAVRGTQQLIASAPIEVDGKVRTLGEITIMDPAVDGKPEGRMVVADPVTSGS